MKSWIVLGLVALGIGGLGAYWAASLSGKAPTHAGKEGVLDVPTTIDLGLVSQGTMADAVFRVRNLGAGPVRLFGFQASCGCVGLVKRTPEGDSPLEDETLAAGEQLEVHTHVHVQVTPTNALRHHVTFRTNIPGRPEFAVELIGQVQVGMYSIPHELSIGSLRPGRPSTTTFRLVDARRQSDRPEFRVITDCPFVTVDKVEPSDRPEDRESIPDHHQVYSVTLVVNPPARGDGFHGWVTAVVGQEILTQLPFSAVVEPSVRLVPSVVVLPRAGASDPNLARVVCQSAEPSELTVVESPTGVGTTILSSPDATPAVISVRIDPEGFPQGGTANIVLSLRPRAGGEPQTVRLPVTVLPRSQRQ